VKSCKDPGSRVGYISIEDVVEEDAGAAVKQLNRWRASV
jgi:hypothetical protein